MQTAFTILGPWGSSAQSLIINASFDQSADRNLDQGLPAFKILFQLTTS